MEAPDESPVAGMRTRQRVHIDLHSAFPGFKVSINLGTDICNALLEVCFNGLPLRLSSILHLNLIHKSVGSSIEKSLGSPYRRYYIPSSLQYMHISLLGALLRILVLGLRLMNGRLAFTSSTRRHFWIYNLTSRRYQQITV